MSHRNATMLARSLARNHVAAPSASTSRVVPVLTPTSWRTSTSSLGRTASTSAKASSSKPSTISTADASATATTSSNDHRTIGKSQSLFLTHDSSPGTPFILPHGMRLARKVERVVRDLYDVYGYDEVQSPQLYKTSLWKRSGHWDNYRDDMFATEGYKERTLRTSPPTQLQGNR